MLLDKAQSYKRKGQPICNKKCLDIYLFNVLCSLKIAYTFQDKRYGCLEKRKYFLKSDPFVDENWDIILS